LVVGCLIAVGSHGGGTGAHRSTSSMVVSQLSRL
jgi:hypothetical protein